MHSSPRSPTIAILVVLALVAGCAGVPSSDLRTVQITRTVHAIAHIEAGDLEMLAYGAAYAHAQDNVCQTADHLVTVRGERSRWFGANAQSLFGLRPLPNDQIDLFVRGHFDDAALAAADATASDDARALMRGVVAGYNRFVADNAERLPAPCKGQPWIRPMAIEDVRRMNELFAIQLGAGLMAGGVASARPPATPAPQSTPAPASAPPSAPPSSPKSQADPAALHAALKELGLIDPQFGSNGWAFGGDVTSNGRGLVLGNPHFPWSGVNRFWQVHLTIPDRLDVMGVSIGHLPLVVIGFNRDVAWTHTVSTGRRFTLYELTLAPGDPTSHIVDGKPEKMQSRTVRFEARGVDGAIASREVIQWSSRWGPLFVLPRAGLNWTETTAYAIRDAGTFDTRAADGWLAIDRARSIEDIRAAAGVFGTLYVNTIAADRHGNSLYTDASLVPDVDTAQLQRCAPSKPAADLLRGAGIVVLNGSRSDCGWSQDPRSSKPGLVAAERQPTIVSRDWVQNSNDSFWLSNPSAKLTGFSPLIGAVDTPQNMRTRAGIDVITREVAARKLDLVAIEAMVLDNRNYLASIVLDDLLGVCSDATQAGAREACAVLKSWDRRDDLGSKGAHLFREWWNAASPTPAFMRVPFNPADPVNTPSGLNVANPDVRAKAIDALDRAATAVLAAGFALDAPLGDVQGRVVKGLRIPVHGGTTSEGVLNVIDSDPLGRNGYAPTSGTSYLQAVTFDGRGPVADALLTYGQSSQPDSPYAFDQLTLFSKKRWLPLPFYPADIAAMRIGEPLTLTLR